MKALNVHPVATLFPDLSPADYAALKEDIRRYGVKVPILVCEGQVLDGRHRYRACRELGRSCPMVEWAGDDAWLEVQSRNLVRRHLAKEQIYAIRMLAAQRLPELAAPMHAARADAARRRAQAKGAPRGIKAARPAPRQESADIIGTQVGVSGTTVKRVERLLRLAPDLLTKVALGELSAKKALQQAVVATEPLTPHTPLRLRVNPRARFDVNVATRRLSERIRAEWKAWPADVKPTFLRVLQLELRDLLYEHTVAVRHLTAPDSPDPARRTA